MCVCVCVLCSLSLLSLSLSLSLSVCVCVCVCVCLCVYVCAPPAAASRLQRLVCPSATPPARPPHPTLLCAYQARRCRGSSAQTQRTCFASSLAAPVPLPATSAQKAACRTPWPRRAPSPRPSCPPSKSPPHARTRTHARLSHNTGQAHMSIPISYVHHHHQRLHRTCVAGGPLLQPGGAVSGLLQEGQGRPPGSRFPCSLAPPSRQSFSSPPVRPRAHARAVCSVYVCAICAAAAGRRSVHVAR